MNHEQFSGSWKQLKGKVREQWGKLTDDDLETIAGKRDQLLGAIEKRYGYAKERAEKELDAFEKACKIKDESSLPKKHKKGL